jgi:peptide/nickel transport system substrate-binding protein
LLYVPRNYIAQIDPLVRDQCDANDSNCQTVNPNGFLRMSKNLPGINMDAMQFNQKVNVVGGNTFLGSGKLDGNGVPPNFFSDIHIRRAFVACFDYATLIKQVFNGEGVHPNGPVIPGEIGYDKNGPEQQYSLDTCKSEFDAAAKDPGFENLNTAGFFIDFAYNTGNTTRQTAGQIIAANVAKINPKFHISVIDEPWPVFLSDQQHSRLGLYYLGWQEDYHDPNDWAAPFLASGGTYASTQSFDPTLQKQMDQLINQALATEDTNARASIYAQLNKLAVDNALDVFAVAPLLRHYEQLWVKGWYYNPIYSGAVNGAAGYWYAYSKGGTQ